MEVMSKVEEKPTKKATALPSSSNGATSYSFEQQTTNDLNKYFMIRNKDNHHFQQFSNRNHYSNPTQSPNFPHHILRISNLNNNGKNEKSKRHSTNFENYNSMHFDSFNSDALFAHKHIHIDESNSSSLTTPSSLGSSGGGGGNGNDGISAALVKPMTKEKILSYSYYTNLNYEKPQKNASASRETNTPASPYSISINSTTNDSASAQENESSLSHVSNAAYQIRRGGEKKVSSSKPNISEMSPQQQQQHESEIFQKIMNKLSELPESVRMKNFNSEVLKSINEHKSGNKDTSNINVNNINATSTKHQNRYFQLPAASNYSTNLDNNNTNSTKAKLIVLNTSNNMNQNNDSNLVRRPKYKSMFIESLENEQNVQDKKLLNLLKNTKINVNSQAGDLILTNLVTSKINTHENTTTPIPTFNTTTSNNNTTTTSSNNNNSNAKSNDAQKISSHNSTQESHAKSNNRNRVSSPNSNESKKKQDKSVNKSKNDESLKLNESYNNPKNSPKSNNKEVIKVSDKVEFILFDKLDDLTNPSRYTSKNANNLKSPKETITNSHNNNNNHSNSLSNKSEKLNLKYQTLSINPRKNNFPDLAQNMKKFYSVNKTKVAHKFMHKDQQLNTSESSNETNSEAAALSAKKHLQPTAAAFQTEEIEKEANFMTSSNDSDSSESINRREKSKKAVATAKIINFYPTNQNVASIKLNQQRQSPSSAATAAVSAAVLPFKNLDLKNNPLVPVRNIKLSTQTIDADSLYTKLLKEKSIESLKKKKYFNNLHNKSLLSSSSSSSSSNDNNFEQHSSKNSMTKPTSAGYLENSSYLSNISAKSNKLVATTTKSVDSNVFDQVNSRKTPDRKSKHVSTPISNGDKETVIQNAKNLLKSLENDSLNAKKSKTTTPTSSQPETTAKNRLKARDINLNLRDLNFSDETLKKIEKVMEKNHLKQLNLYVNTEENETSSKINLSKLKDGKDTAVSSTVSTQGSILQRKISTPPPMPHILDMKSKKYVSNVFKAPESPKTPQSTPTPPTKHQQSSSKSTKNNTITSSIRDGKIEKPIRVNHGLPPPPPALINRQTPTLALFQSKISSNDKDLFMRKLATPLVGVSTPIKTNGNITSIPPRYVNSSLLSSREDSGKSVERNNTENQRYEFYLDKKSKTTNPKEASTPNLDNSLISKEKKNSMENILDEMTSNEKNKQDKKLNLKNRIEINNDKDMFSWNCAQLDNFLKSKNLNTNLTQLSEKKSTPQNRMTPIIFSNPVKMKPAAQVLITAPIIKESSKEYTDTNKNNTNVDQAKLSELADLSDDGSGIETNFYENYSKENDKRKKEGNGFLMLLPGIAIPIDTDAGDSDEDNSYNSS